MFYFCSSAHILGRMHDFDPEKELARDIGYALAQSPFKAKGQRIETLRLLADGIVAHLRRAGWLFTLKPPEALHGPATPRDSRADPTGQHERLRTEKPVPEAD